MAQAPAILEHIGRIDAAITILEQAKRKAFREWHSGDFRRSDYSWDVQKAAMLIDDLNEVLNA